MFCPSTERTACSLTTFSWKKCRVNYLIIEPVLLRTLPKRVLLSFQMIIDLENSSGYMLIRWIISCNSTRKPSVRKSWTITCTHSPVVLLQWLTWPFQLIKRQYKLFIYGLIRFSLKSMGILPYWEVGQTVLQLWSWEGYCDLSLRKCESCKRQAAKLREHCQKKVRKSSAKELRSVR